jgi:hypothetical protein
MSIGNHDRRIEFFATLPGSDNGYTIEPGAWASRGTRKARYIPSMRKEIFQSAGRETTMPVIFEVRSDTLTRQVNEQWMIRYDGRDYDIKGVQELGRRAGLRIEAVAGDE